MSRATIRATVRAGTGAALAALALLGASGCGVSSEDEPQPVEGSVEQPRVSPTVRSSPSPAQTTTSTTVTSPPSATDVRSAPALPSRR